MQIRRFEDYRQALRKGEGMITNEREQKICDKYRARDEKGFVHCNECPLNKGEDAKCKATSHYNRKTKEWEYD